MRPQLLVKILIIFGIMLAAWFFYRIIRLLLPMFLIAIAVGYLWDWSSNNQKNDKYDNY